MRFFGEWPARLAQPIGLSVDFRDARWVVSNRCVAVLVLLAVASDLVVQELSGSRELWSTIASLLTPVFFIWTPVRLRPAMGSLYLVQAWLSFLVWMLCGWLQATQWVGTSALALVSLWGVIALGKMILAYLRTPKAEFQR